MTYIVITSSDGEFSIKTMNKETLEERLNDEYYGDETYPANFIKLEDLKENPCPYWSHQDVLIIKGDAVEPKQKEVITKWEV